MIQPAKIGKALKAPNAEPRWKRICLSNPIPQNDSPSITPFDQTMLALFQLMKEA